MGRFFGQGIAWPQSTSTFYHEDYVDDDGCVIHNGYGGNGDGEGEVFLGREPHGLELCQPFILS